MTSPTRGDDSLPRLDRRPPMGRRMAEVVAFPAPRPLPDAEPPAGRIGRLSEIERELVRLRVAIRTGSAGLAAATRHSLFGLAPGIVPLVEATLPGRPPPPRLQALLAFVDAAVASPRNIRAAHLEALRRVGFDSRAMAGLTRVVAAAIYESSLGIDASDVEGEPAAAGHLGRARS
jgi:hypothetical protein